MSDDCSKEKVADPKVKECVNCATIGAHLTCAKCKAASYCSKACQKQHWKNGHKELCLTPEERRPQTLASRGVDEFNPRGAEEDGGDSGEKQCPVCLDPLSGGAVCTLPCKHAFHQECVKQLQKHGVQQVCPLCRAALSSGPDKLFEDAARMYVTVKRQVGHVVGRNEHNWQSLTDSQQRELAMVIDMCTRAANVGHKGAQSQLGYMYFGGHGVAQDLKKAAHWYRKAADQGYVDAQYMLGTIYRQGKVISLDFQKAAHWYRKAADQGHIDAQCSLGIMCYEGRGFAQDQKKAAQWFRKAADQGRADTQHVLGIMYHQGKGVSQDWKKAAQWFRKAADQGDVAAQCSLGNMYRQGQGVAQDHKEAVQWYRKAADQGHDNAQFQLGRMYYGGQGVTEDRKNAAKLCQKAADQGHKSAQQLLMQMRDMP